MFLHIYIYTLPSIYTLKNHYKKVRIDNLKTVPVEKKI